MALFDLYHSVAAMRSHQQWLPDELRIEPPGPKPEVLDALKKAGHNVNLAEMGCKVQAVAAEGNLLRAVSDPRGEGRALSENSIATFNKARFNSKEKSTRD